MRIAVFASGSGSNVQAIVDAIAAGRLSATVGLCVSNKASSGVLERARTKGIPTVVLDPRTYAQKVAYTAALHEALEAHRIDFIALAGYLRKIPTETVRRFRARIVNIHPALLPDHGGPGMYGMHVHRAVIARKDTFSGATIHFVDEDYDTGPIILQDAVPVRQDDTAETLAARVLKVEHRLYPAALSLIADGRVSLTGASVHINSQPVPAPAT